MPGECKVVGAKCQGNAGECKGMPEECKGVGVMCQGNAGECRGKKGTYWTRCKVTRDCRVMQGNARGM